MREVGQCSTEYPKPRISQPHYSLAAFSCCLKISGSCGLCLMEIDTLRNPYRQNHRLVLNLCLLRYSTYPALLIRLSKLKTQLRCHFTRFVSKMTTIKQYKQYTFNPPIEVSLPTGLTAAEFDRLLRSDSNSEVAFTFPALDNWLTKLLHNFRLQQDKAHPFHKHPYKLNMIEVQAVDWFWRDRKGREDKLGFMKIQSKIETDPYIHDGEPEARADWIPGAVFLRGGSVALLVSNFDKVSNWSDRDPCRLSCNQKTRKARSRSM